MRNTRLKFLAEDKHNGLRLDKFLSEQEDLGTRSFIQTLMEQDLVLFRGQPAKASHKVTAGEVFEVYLPPPRPPSLEPYDFPLTIAYEDSEVIVVDKPAGLVVHPSHGHDADTLVNALVHHNKTLSTGYMKERPGLIHRLDRDTSGLIVVAKTDSAQASLAQQFQERTVARRYWALVLGRVRQDEGRLESYLSRHPNDRKRFTATEEPAGTSSKHAITDYRVLSRSHEFSFVELKLHTGRTHQIRVHLSELGHPIVGDDLYGGKKRARGLKSPALRDAIQSMNRFALHAFELGFYHLKLNERLTFYSSWPADLEDIIQSSKVELPAGVTKG